MFLFWAYSFHIIGLGVFRVVMGAKSPSTYVVVLFLDKNELGLLNDFIRDGFRNALMNGCWKLEVHLFTDGRLEDIITSARDAILNNIHLSFRLWDHHNLEEAENILSWLSRRVGEDVKKVAVYVSQSLRDRVLRHLDLLPGDHTEFLKGVGGDKK